MSNTTNYNLFKYEDNTNADFRLGNPNMDIIDTQLKNNANNINLKINKAGDTFTGIAKAFTNSSYITSQLRNVILSPDDANVNSMQNGEIWIKYK